MTYIAIKSNDNRRDFIIGLNKVLGDLPHEQTSFMPEQLQDLQVDNRKFRGLSEVKINTNRKKI